jgi:hypothetical protein
VIKQLIARVESCVRDYPGEAIVELLRCFPAEDFGDLGEHGQSTRGENGLF